jgi:hypothetical protein
MDWDIQIGGHQLPALASLRPFVDALRSNGNLLDGTWWSSSLAFNIIVHIYSISTCFQTVWKVQGPFLYSRQDKITLTVSEIANTPKKTSL